MLDPLLSSVKSYEKDQIKDNMAREFKQKKNNQKDKNIKQETLALSGKFKLFYYV